MERKGKMTFSTTGQLSVNGKEKGIAITGSEGFIGRNLIKKLKEKDYKIKSIDKLIGYDICNPTNFDFKDCHTVIHLAAVSDINEAEKNKEATLETNCSGTFNIVEKAYNEGIKKMIYISSAGVYSDNDKRVYEDDLKEPKTIYGESKMIGEIFCETFSVQNNFQIPILRLFNVYGENSGKGLIGNLENAIKSKRVFKINGAGDHVRDYVHIDDVCNAIIKTIESEEEFYGFPINIGTGLPHSVTDVIEMAQRYIDFPYFYTGNYPVEEIEYSCANIETAEEYLDWRPKISLEEGLKFLEKYR